MMSKNSIIEEIVRKEGGFVNDKKDSGGATKYGITKAVARKYGYTGAMRNLALKTAKEIYSKRYWDKMNLDSIFAISPSVAKELMDTGVNMGTGRAGKFLQQSLNALLPKAKLKVDGAIGQRTLLQLKVFINKRGMRGQEVLRVMLNSLQCTFYIRLTERRPKDKRFIFGWVSNRVLSS